MSPPRFTPEFKDEAVVKSPTEAIQSLKYRQGLASQRTVSTNGSVLLSQTKQISKPPSCLSICHISKYALLFQ